MQELFAQAALPAIIGVPLIPAGWLIGASICLPSISNAEVTFRSVALSIIVAWLLFAMIVSYSMFTITGLGGTVMVAGIATWLHVLLFVLCCAAGLIITDYQQRKALNPQATLTRL